MMADRKQGGKNRRDAHGVYERREARGKARTEGRTAKPDGRTGKQEKRNGKPDARTGRQESRAQAPREARETVRNSYLRSQRKYRDAEARRDVRPEDRKRAEEREEGTFLIGRNPVIEALRAGREMEKIYVAEGTAGSVSVIRGLAKEQGVVIDVVPKVRLDAMAPGEKHQGVIAEIPAFGYAEMEDIYARAEASGEQPLIVLLDEINDPHNLGAIIRTAECVGAHGVIIPKRRACGLTGTVAKSSAGAIENMPVVRVTNLSRTIEELQAQGIWVAACDMNGKNCYDAPLEGAVAIVIGNEGKGISRNVLEKCDFVVSIPMKGTINSLNASNAAAIFMYEAVRQRIAND